jgi:cytochrome c oxidase subunit 3/cytochrome o ubiquinol oxidase subunit 3
MNAASHTFAHEEPAPQGVRGDVGNLTPLQIGMLAFLVSEVSFFSTLIVAYVTFVGKDTSGPTPAEVLSLPLAMVSSVFLLSSSFTLFLAEKSLHAGARGRFQAWWGATILLGAIFLVGTALEWSELIGVHRLTISTNLFGSTYYMLVGFHALHVTCGVIAMTIVLALALRAGGNLLSRTGVEAVSWYWHFVDAVWVVVFCVVYLWGR